ncbi:tRNA (guanine(37)-N(1))-methyltransferase [Candidatus Saccharibacteria bacterium]|nr:tRNA (guanine(37)-N(1))-methyltransferase [Candidatus Saccharibacteria bacterium]
MSKVKFTIITLFEDAIRPYLEISMMKKAADKGILEYNFVNLRDFGLGPHKSVDDTPYGGGDGMVLRVEPIYAAVEKVKAESKARGETPPVVILPTPDGKLWTEELARQLAGVRRPDTSVDAIEESIRGKSSSTSNVVSEPPESAQPAKPQASAKLPESPKTSESDSQFVAHYLIICPHYEGYDARILPLVDYQICLGPYVLTGGELPALIIIDSVVRLLDGVLGGDTSADLESFSTASGDNIEAPQYTKPYEFRGMTVPDVLLSGNHKKVAEWRKSHEKKLGHPVD